MQWRRPEFIFLLTDTMHAETKRYAPSLKEAHKTEFPAPRGQCHLSTEGIHLYL